MDPAQELKGIALVKALRGGGFVLYMRHANAGDFKPSCPGESVLGIEGEAQARTVGAALRQLKVPIASVFASETCRAKETAQLLGAGTVSTRADLNPPASRPAAAEYAERFRFLLEQPPAGSNLLMVSHIQGARTPEESVLIELAEIAVYRYRGSGKAQVVARIPLAAWGALIEIAQSLPE